MSMLAAMILTQVLSLYQPEARSPVEAVGPAVDVFTCPASDALVAQGMLAVENLGAQDPQPVVGFLYRGAGSANMFASSTEPKTETCTFVGRAVVRATGVTARLPRSCGATETIVAADLVLVELSRPVKAAEASVVVARRNNREVGRVVATSGRFALLTAAGTVTEKLERGASPDDVREHLRANVAQLVGADPSGRRIVVVDEGAEGVATQPGGGGDRGVDRWNVGKFALFEHSCDPDRP